jgi:hypothetical protein
MYIVLTFVKPIDHTWCVSAQDERNSEDLKRVPEPEEDAEEVMEGGIPPDEGVADE